MLPQLAYRGMDKLGTVIITHPDSDHIGGIPSILRSVPVGRVLRSGYRHSSSLFTETDALLDSLNIPQRAVRTGDTLMLSPQVRAYVLYRPKRSREDGPNAHSVMLLVCYGETSFLLQEMLPLRPTPACAAVQGPASKRCPESRAPRIQDQSTSAFLNGVLGARSRDSSTAGIVETSVRMNESHHNPGKPYCGGQRGGAHRYGLPNEEVLDRLTATGFEVVLTSRAGGVWFRTDENDPARDWR